jgi:diguanylate cyclase (GGDEF)-like protein
MHVSFRTRLTLFFLLLVVLPVIALAVVAIGVERTNEDKEIDGRLSQAQRAAEAPYDRQVQRAARAVNALARDTVLAAAVQGRDEVTLQLRAAEIRRRRRLARVELRVRGVRPVVIGRADAIAVARRALQASGGRLQGEVVLYATMPNPYADAAQASTGFDVVVTRGGQVLASTLNTPDAASLPLRGTVTVGGTRYRVTSFTKPGGADAPIVVRILAADTEDTVNATTLLLLGVLITFLLCALVFALTAARSLQAQTQRLLDAAQRLGRGDFTVHVPTEGNDEFALLGKEFNSMARQLNARMNELDVERTRLQETVRRVGESIGKGLDRDALLGIVVQTAVDGVGADSGRVLMRDGPEGAPAEAARAGDVSAYLQLLQATEEAALEDQEPVEMEYSGANALARPMYSQDGVFDVLGVISIARPGRPFSPREQELLAYLANQAAISIENVDLHRTVQRQAVTDELTGLFNHRRFQEVMTAEVERTKRFGHELGLIMLDIDNFKRVNDRYGHLQGDLVLREVARVLRESSREIDEPARYGGEEMAVALPQTGLQGAYEFAERVRRRIEDLELPLLDSSGTVRVTASFGAAALPRSADIDKDALVAAADAALYKAKRAGKNRTVKAE